MSRPIRTTSKTQTGRKPLATSSRTGVTRSQTGAPKPGPSRSQMSGLSSISAISAGKRSTTSVRGRGEKPQEKPGGRPSMKKVLEEAPKALPAPEQKKEFQLPALSVIFRPKVTQSEFEKMKKKTIRRHHPPGEDIKQINEIIRRLKHSKDTTVQEFISLIAPSTADRGEVLRSVMQEDLNNFRKLARKVYETITQDNSDVLLNQQLQLAEYYRDKKNLLQEKMMRSIQEIYMLAPKFDFDRYAAEKEKYLEELFPIPAEINIAPEEYEMMRRQAAYHRLQWLRSEGERLNEENNSLKKRLNQLKRMHKEEQMRMLDMERQAEEKQKQLEEQEAQKMETLEMLNDSLEKSIIEKEKNIRLKTDRAAISSKSKGKEVKKKKSRTKRPPWNVEAAQEIEADALEKLAAAEADTRTKQRSPFHFSPIKTPPPKPQKQHSPFHYSPPKSPPQYASPPPQAAPVTHETTPTSSKAPPRLGRGAHRPRDSWGGFF